MGEGDDIRNRELLSQCDHRAPRGQEQIAADALSGLGLAQIDEDAEEPSLEAFIQAVPNSNTEHSTLRSYWSSARSAYRERPRLQPQREFIPLEPNSIRNEEENTMKTILKPGSIAFGFGLMLTTLGQAQPGAPSGTPLSFKVPPHAMSAISFSAAPNVQCSVAPANGSGSGQAFTVYTNDEGTATFYVTPSEESSAAQLVATCSSGNQQTIEIQPVAGAKPLVAPAPSNAATNARLGYTVRPALTGDPMALSNQELVKRKYPVRPDPQKAPGAYASWLKAVSKPATFIPPKTVNVEGPSQHPAKISADASTGPYPYDSPYWSGYLLYTGVNQKPFVWIEGDWNVPALVAGEDGTTTASILGIGFDGFAGTHVVAAGTGQSALLQGGILYVSYVPLAWIVDQEQLVISNFTINPGDEIYGEVWMGDSLENFNPNGGYANFYLHDLTTGQSTYLLTPFYGIFAGISAEWIMERSSNNGGYSDLADYSYAVMRSAWAYTYDGNYVNYQVAPFGGLSYQITMYNGNDILSSVYPIDSDTMEFIWQNFH